MNENKKAKPFIKQNFKLIVPLIMLGIILISTNACTSRKQEQINTKAEEISQMLYVPDGAVLLRKEISEDRLLYQPGCTGVIIDLVYGVQRPLIDIVNEYELHLLESGWELHPGYTQRDIRHTYRNGNTTKLVTGDGLLIEKDIPNSRSFSTIYSVQIAYTEPSHDDCTG